MSEKEVNSIKELETKGPIKYAALLIRLEQAGIEPRYKTVEAIKNAILPDAGGYAVLGKTDCNIRISFERKSGYYIVWVTNRYEDPDHPMHKKFNGLLVKID